MRKERAALRYFLTTSGDPCHVTTVTSCYRAPFQFSRVTAVPAQKAFTFSSNWNRTTVRLWSMMYVWPSQAHATTSSLPSPYTHTHTHVYITNYHTVHVSCSLCYVIETRDTRVSHRTTDRDVQFLQCKELVIHLHRPQELLRAVHKLQGTCTNKNTRYITGDKTPRRVIIRDLTPKNIHCTSVLVRFQRYLSISQGSPPQPNIKCCVPSKVQSANKPPLESSSFDPTGKKNNKARVTSEYLSECRISNASCAKGKLFIPHTPVNVIIIRNTCRPENVQSANRVAAAITILKREVAEL